ncbi:MAG: DUF4351 domain-containing protein [Acidobacteriota bacterium]
MQQRFGALEETIQAHVRALPLEKIEALSDELFRFAVRADLEAWLTQHPLPNRAQHELALAEAPEVAGAGRQLAGVLILAMNRRCLS